MGSLLCRAELPSPKGLLPAELPYALEAPEQPAPETEQPAADASEVPARAATAPERSAPRTSKFGGTPQLRPQLSRSASGAAQRDQEGQLCRKGSWSSAGLRSSSSSVSAAPKHYGARRRDLAREALARVRARAAKGEHAPGQQPLQTLNPGGSEARLVGAAYAEDGQGAPQPSSFTVQRVHPPADTVARFAAAAAAAKAQGGRVIAVFHGITAPPTGAIVNDILRRGLDPHRNRSALFGKGAYVATCGAKARMYAYNAKWEVQPNGEYRERHPQPLHILVLLLALRGSIEVGTHGATHTHVTSDSVICPTQFCIPADHIDSLLVTHLVTIDEPAPPPLRRAATEPLSRCPTTWGSAPIGAARGAAKFQASPPAPPPHAALESRAQRRTPSASGRSKSPASAAHGADAVPRLTRRASPPPCLRHSLEDTGVLREVRPLGIPAQQQPPLHSAVSLTARTVPQQDWQQRGWQHRARGRQRAAMVGRVRSPACERSASAQMPPPRSAVSQEF